MQPVLSAISNVLPLSYAVDAMDQVTHQTQLSGDFALDAAVIAGCVLAALALGAATLRRRTA
jgi:ABC-type multidrug transport system permease subunit